MPLPRPFPYLQRYLVEEVVEDYREALMPRRELIRRVLAITGSIPATAAILLQLGCGTSNQPGAGGGPAGLVASASPETTAVAPTISSSSITTSSTASVDVASASASGETASTAGGVTVSPTDPAIDAAMVEFPGKAGTLKGYRSMPKATAKAPGLLIIHENLGLTDHIKDVTRRYAKAGYLTVAVDLVSRQGGTDHYADSTQVTGILGQAKQADLLQDLLSGLDYLKTLSGFAGAKAGVVGYCFGGGLTWLLAINSGDLAAAIPYYGPPPQPLDDVQTITAAVLAFYGGKDTRITSSEPAMHAAMQKYHKTFEFMIYPEAGHAFNRDNGPSYDAAAAKDAYSRSLAWLQKYLGA